MQGTSPSMRPAFIEMPQIPGGRGREAQRIYSTGPTSCFLLQILGNAASAEASSCSVAGRLDRGLCIPVLLSFAAINCFAAIYDVLPYLLIMDGVPAQARGLKIPNPTATRRATTDAKKTTHDFM